MKCNKKKTKVNVEREGRIAAIRKTESKRWSENEGRKLSENLVSPPSRSNNVLNTLDHSKQSVCVMNIERYLTQIVIRHMLLDISNRTPVGFHYVVKHI